VDRTQGPLARAWSSFSAGRGSTKTSLSLSFASRLPIQAVPSLHCVLRHWEWARPWLLHPFLLEVGNKGTHYTTFLKSPGQRGRQTGLATPELEKVWSVSWQFYEFNLPKGSERNRSVLLKVNGSNISEFDMKPYLHFKSFINYVSHNEILIRPAFFFGNEPAGPEGTPSWVWFMLRHGADLQVSEDAFVFYWPWLNETTTFTTWKPWKSFADRKNWLHRYAFRELGISPARPRFQQRENISAGLQGGMLTNSHTALPTAPGTQEVLSKQCY
jgi:hypothetical protein